MVQSSSYLGPNNPPNNYFKKCVKLFEKTYLKWDIPKINNFSKMFNKKILK